MTYHVLIKLERGSSDRDSISEIFETESEAREFIKSVEWACSFDTESELFEALLDRELFKEKMPKVYEDFISWFKEHEIEDYEIYYFWEIFTNEIQLTSEPTLIFEVESVLLTKSEIIMSY